MTFVKKKIFIVYAHPEPRSLNGSLKDFAVGFLKSLGHEVIVSDLYKMEWKAIGDKGDFLNHDEPQRLHYIRSSARAYIEDKQTEDITKEQKKLLWADVIIFQFPYWWFGMPAILKGWVDRVFACGFAYGVGKHDGKHWGKRYGDGTLKGKLGMLSITIGGRETQYHERGVNGNIDDLLFPIHHGMLWYPGISVLPPNIIYQADSISEEIFELHKLQYKNRLANLDSTTPILYRRQNDGDYDDKQQLKEELIDGKRGFSLHVKRLN